MGDNEQRQEFLQEMQLMKDVGSHPNIVNMLGCCTLTEPMFLIVEYVSFGDLLHYLRKRRGQVSISVENIVVYIPHCDFSEILSTVFRIEGNDMADRVTTESECSVCRSRWCKVAYGQSPIPAC